jgi:hypothetical protein
MDNNVAKYRGVLSKSITSDKSLASYETRLQKLSEKTNKSLDFIIQNPRQIYPLIKQHYPNITTRKNVMTPILTLFKNDGSLQQHTEAWSQWRRYHDDMNSLQEANAKKNQMSSKQEKNYTSTEEVALKILELKKADAHKTLQSSMQYVLLNLLNDIKPKRSDLGNVLIYRNIDPHNTQINYLVLSDKEAMQSYFVLNAYSKTKKVYGKVEEEISQACASVIKESLRRYPREHLFVNRFGKPYMNNDSYGKFVVKCFSDHFGRKTGTSLWRHIYIKEKVDPGASEEQLEDVARLMLHSTKLQQRYRFVNGPARVQASSSDPNKICICIDKDKLKSHLQL